MGSWVLGVQADATILVKFFSLISSIISFCAASVHRNALAFEIITFSSISLAYSTNLPQSTFPLIFIPH